MMRLLPIHFQSKEYNNYANKSQWNSTNINWSMNFSPPHSNTHILTHTHSHKHITNKSTKLKTNEILRFTFSHFILCTNSIIQWFTRTWYKYLLPIIINAPLIMNITPIFFFRVYSFIHITNVWFNCFLCEWWKIGCCCCSLALSEQFLVIEIDWTKLKSEVLDIIYE